MKFKVGQQVNKFSGDYGGVGKVICGFIDEDRIRYVVSFRIQNGFGTFYHILTEKQLEDNEQATMILVFNPERLSRSINRKEWKEIWRWKRVTEKQLAKSVEEQIGLLVAYGTTMPEYMRKDMIDVIVNPPLCIYSMPEGNQPINLRPGAINYVR